MSRPQLSPGLVVVQKLDVAQDLSDICDLDSTGDVVLESVPIHIIDVVVESVPVHILVHRHIWLANVVQSLDLLNVTSPLSIVIVVSKSRFPDLVIS